MIMKGCMQWNPVEDSKRTAHQFVFQLPQQANDVNVPSMYRDFPLRWLLKLSLFMVNSEGVNLNGNNAVSEVCLCMYGWMDGWMNLLNSI